MNVNLSHAGHRDSELALETKVFGVVLMNLKRPGARDYSYMGSMIETV